MKVYYCEEKICLHYIDGLAWHDCKLDDQNNYTCPECNSQTVMEEE